MQISAQELALLLKGEVEGDPTVLVNRPSKIEEGGTGSISFLAKDQYEHFAYTSTASILLVSKSFSPKKSIQATLIRVDDVYACVATLFEKFGQIEERSTGIDPTANVHSTAVIGSNATIGMFSIIMENVQMGENCIIHPQVFIGKDCVIGNKVSLYPGVRIMHGSVIGDNCVIHSNTVIGSDGFGFAPQADGSYKKIAQLGNAIIEDDVEIGSNCTIDRATMGSTIIRKGAKLDNLIQVGHNAEVGENTVIASQAGIAGSTKLGKNCRIGGQAGFVGHVSIADGTGVQAQSGVASAVKEPNTMLFGSPAIAYRDYIRSYAVFKKLPELYKKIHLLEKLLNSDKSK